MYEFKLPDVGEGIHEAEIVKWLVKVGDTVTLNQPILEIQTDKAIVEIPAPTGGKVTEIRAAEGSLAHVGDILIIIEPTNGQTNNRSRSPAALSKTRVRAQSEATLQAKATGLATGPGQRVLAAPYVRKLARELGVDLAKVPGSGPAGRVLPDDLQRFVEGRTAEPEPTPPPAKPKPIAAPPEPPPGLEKISVQPVQMPALPATPRRGEEISQEEPLQGLRRRIAERMELAWKVPQVTSFDEVDAARLVALRHHLKAEVEKRGLRLTYLPFIIKAVVQALKEFPYINASLDMEQQKIYRHHYYHIGIATAVPDGLLVPVIRHADQISLLQLAGELARLADLAQQRKLGVEELSGSTFTITNFGSFGSYQGTPIVNPPEAAILGIGRIEERAVAINGQVEVRPTLPLALSFDHRLIDGAVAGQFLRRLKTLLADPNLLFLELV
jgi:pyruvate dehydrogenase E2 component (dihydrolipoamide acetyltransferase)